MDSAARSRVEKKGADGSFGDPAVSFRVEGRSSMHRRGYMHYKRTKKSGYDNRGRHYFFPVFFFA
jgi:hypothetical protein